MSENAIGQPNAPVLRSFVFLDTTGSSQTCSTGTRSWTRSRLPSGASHGRSSTVWPSMAPPNDSRGRASRSQGSEASCPFHKLELHEIGELVVSEKANVAEISNPGGVLEIRGDQPTRHWVFDRQARAELSSRPSVTSSGRARTPMRRRGGNNGCVPRFVEKERRPPLRHQGIISGGNLRVFENLAQTLVAVDAS